MILFLHLSCLYGPVYGIVGYVFLILSVDPNHTLVPNTMQHIFVVVSVPSLQWCTIHYILARRAVRPSLCGSHYHLTSGFQSSPRPSHHSHFRSYHANNGPRSSFGKYTNEGRLPQLVLPAHNGTLRGRGSLLHPPSRRGLFGSCPKTLPGK